MDLGTPHQPSARKLMLLGSGELGREVALEAMRLGIHVIACDAYPNAPAMQFAHESRVFDMQDPQALRAAIGAVRPDWVVPEIEAIATDALIDLEAEGVCIIPTARATQLTMDRKGIRRLAAEELQLPTGAYRFADSHASLRTAIEQIGYPCVVKPTMSSSGKGQSVVRNANEIDAAWTYALEGSRGSSAEVIVEAFVDFDREITLLTVRTHHEGTLVCPPIGHRQERGDYQESWQPEALSAEALAEATEISRRVTDGLGGFGLFGVELFICGDKALFSEVSPRPHDTGMVTMATQNMSEFELHVRAIVGLPIGRIELSSPGASAVILADRAGSNPRFIGADRALQVESSQLRLFGKPATRLHRRMGVALARGESVAEARARACEAARHVRVEVDD